MLNDNKAEEEEKLRAVGNSVLERSEYSPG